jgi:hypothetical protein
MSYDMSFQGTFAYPSNPMLQAAISAFESDECIDESVISRKDLQIIDTEIRLSISASAPASWWDTTCGVVTILAEHATTGHVDCEYDGGDGEESIFRVRIHAGGEEEELDEDPPDA